MWTTQRPEPISVLVILLLEMKSENPSPLSSCASYLICVQQWGGCLCVILNLLTEVAVLPAEPPNFLTSRWFCGWSTRLLICAHAPLPPRPGDLCGGGFDVSGSLNCSSKDQIKTDVWWSALRKKPKRLTTPFAANSGSHNTLSFIPETFS